MPLTEQEILKFALSQISANGDRFSTGVQYGAKWANEQNAAEIAELREGLQALYNIQEFVESTSWDKMQDWKEICDKSAEILKKYEQ